jgi:hypothetical protein
MTDQLISFETAKLAKEKGFSLDYPTACYVEDGNLSISQNLLNERITGKPFPKIIFTAPTQSLLQKWLREVHDIHLFVEVYVGNQYEYTLTSELIDVETDDYEDFKSYEKALEAGLIAALNLIKI